MRGGFDITTKLLVDNGPEGWLRFLEPPFTSCHVLDGELGTITAQADRLIEVEGPIPCVVHLCPQHQYRDREGAPPSDLRPRRAFERAGSEL